MAGWARRFREFLHEKVCICACRDRCGLLQRGVRGRGAAAPVVKATTMSDAQMDKVTAGDRGGGPGGDGGNAQGLGIGAPGNSGRPVGSANGSGRFGMR